MNRYGNSIHDAAPGADRPYPLVTHDDGYGYRLVWYAAASNELKYEHCDSLRHATEIAFRMFDDGSGLPQSVEVGGIVAFEVNQLRHAWLAQYQRSPAEVHIHTDGWMPSMEPFVGNVADAARRQMEREAVSPAGSSR